MKDELHRFYPSQLIGLMIVTIVTVTWESRIFYFARTHLRIWLSRIFKSSHTGRWSGFIDHTH